MATRGRKSSKTPKIAPSPRALRIGLNEGQARFVAAYVKEPDKGAAAVRAGFTRQYGYDLFNQPGVRDAIMEELKRCDVEDATLGRVVLRTLAKDADSEHVRKQAATELMNRALGTPVSVSERRQKIVLDQSDRELLARIAELSKELNIQPEVLEGEFTEVEEPLRGDATQKALPAAKNGEETTVQTKPE